MIVLGHRLPHRTHLLFIGSLCCIAVVCLVATAFAQAPAAGQVAPVQPAQPATPAPPTPEQVAQWHKAQEQLHNDWPALSRYREANSALGPAAPGENRVVFYGDSITDAWIKIVPEFFAGKPYLDRGISGQTTPQMLVRFRQDVVNLRPKVVVILAGTNDIAGNTGPSTPEMIQDNFQSMVEIARTNGISPVLASILPAFDYPWKTGREPAPKIVAFNAWLKDYAAKNNLVYLDYFSAMADARQGLPPSLSTDGVHPNRAGYAIMGALAEKAIAQALAGTSK